MKKITFYLLGLAAGILLVQGSLFAEMIRGQVTAINKQNQSITILEQDASGAMHDTQELAVKPDAQFAGVESLDDLEVGDEILAEVDDKIFGKSEVKSLTRSAAVQPADYAPGYTSDYQASGEVTTVTTTSQSPATEGEGPNATLTNSPSSPSSPAHADSSPMM